MVEWRDHAHGSGASADLGYGLRLAVSYESSQRLEPGEPKYNIVVMGERITGRSTSFSEAKARAEEIARARLSEALAAL